MSKWEKVRLGDVCVKKVTTVKAESELLIDYIDISSINNGTKKIESYSTYLLDKAPSRAKQLVIKDDILVSTVRPNLNAIALVEKKYNNTLVASTGFCVLRCNSNLDSGYLFHFCKSNYFVKSLMLVARGASYPAVSNSDVLNATIPLPPLELQKEIAHHLDTVSELLTLRKKQLEELDELIKSVFYDMFGDPVRNDKGWEVKSVNSLCESIIGGGTPSKSKPEYYEGEIPWVTPKDMKQRRIIDSIDHINMDAINNSSAKLIPKGALLMVIRSGILKHTLPLAITEVEVAINQDMKAFVTSKSITVEYLLNTFKMYEPTILNRVRSVTADNLEFNTIKELLIPVPPISLQKEFESIIEKIEEQKTLVKQSIEETQTLFDCLMSQYFDE